MLTRFDTAKGFDADAGPFRQFSLTQAFSTFQVYDDVKISVSSMVSCTSR